MKLFKKSIGAITIMLTLSFVSLPVLAKNSDSTSTDKYGTLYGETLSCENGFTTLTTVGKSANIGMNYSLQHNATGQTVGSPADWPPTYTRRLTDDIDLSHWADKLVKGEKVALFTSHYIGGTSYVVYTSAVTTY